jgi:hypothetical protein
MLAGAVTGNSSSAAGKDEGLTAAERAGVAGFATARFVLCGTGFTSAA